ncbi:hypothetical protein [Mycobacterium sp.]|uniref:hypothetical protein n=1 Tax=Mycobacterium sp. TaxID=1785 RepID=UPI003BB074AC
MAGVEGQRSGHIDDFFAALEATIAWQIVTSTPPARRRRGPESRHSPDAIAPSTTPPTDSWWSGSRSTLAP